MRRLSQEKHGETRLHKTVRPISVIVQLGAMVVVATLIPLFVGLWLDVSLKTTPWIMLAGMLTGVVSSVVVVHRVIGSLYKQLE